MFERLKEKYLLGYVRKDQLERYVALGLLTVRHSKFVEKVCFV